MSKTLFLGTIVGVYLYKVAHLNFSLTCISYERSVFKQKQILRQSVLHAPVELLLTVTHDHCKRDYIFSSLPTY